MFNFLFPRIKVVLKGDPRVVIRGLNKIPAEAMDAANEALRAEARLIAIRMKDKMKGPKSGMIYTWKKAAPGENADFFVRGGHGKWFPVVNRGTTHQASGPDEPPAVDTKGSTRKSLYKSINWRQTAKMSKFLAVEVGVDWNAPYAKWLEPRPLGLGPTRYMRKARPFLMPSVREEIDSGNMWRNINARLTAAGFRPLR
jgi:hypothetical protein